MKRRWSIFLGGAAALAMFLVTGTSAAPPEVTAIRGGRIVPVSGAAIDGGTVLISGGKITAVGRDVAVPRDATVIDAGGGWVLPGLIDAHTTTGLSEDRRDGPPDELSDPSTPQLLVLDGFNPFDKRVRRLVMAGITAAMVTPGRANVVGGQPAVVGLAGNAADEMALKSPAGVKFSLGEGPKSAYGSKSRLPGTRMGAAYIIRKALLEAGEYGRKWKDYEAKTAAAPAGKPLSPPPARSLALEPLARLLEGTLTAYIETYRADDIMTALRLVDEFKLKAVLIGCTEGFRVAGEISRRKIPVIVGPIGVGPRRLETEMVGLENAARLAKAGVVVALDTEDAMGIGAEEELPLTAALAVKGGLPRDTALRGITLTAAELLGVGDMVGSLEPGKRADIAIFSGDPLHYRSRVQKVLIAGDVVFTQ